MKSDCAVIDRGAGDVAIAVILGKALPLAGDRPINDPAITWQIGRRATEELVFEA